MAKGRKPRNLRLNVYRSRGTEPARTPAGELLLEYFSDHELLAWRARGEDIQRYHYLWYFELESQRASVQTQLLEALSVIQGISVSLDGWRRSVTYKYSATPLSCLGSLKWVGGRFNYGVDIDSTRFPPLSRSLLGRGHGNWDAGDARSDARNDTCRTHGG